MDRATTMPRTVYDLMDLYPQGGKGRPSALYVPLRPVMPNRREAPTSPSVVPVRILRESDLTVPVVTQEVRHDFAPFSAPYRILVVDDAYEGHERPGGASPQGKGIPGATGVRPAVRGCRSHSWASTSSGGGSAEARETAHR